MEFIKADSWGLFEGMPRPWVIAGPCSARNNNAPVYFFNNKWNRKHDGRAYCAECRHQQGWRRRFPEIIYACPACERVEQPEAEFVCMCHRQHRQPYIFFVARVCGVGGEYVPAEISVAQHYSFCVSCRAGSVYYGCNIVRKRFFPPGAVVGFNAGLVQDGKCVDVDCSQTFQTFDPGQQSL